jgi:diguanylate cyclase (GGDEF)-like protein
MQPSDRFVHPDRQRVRQLREQRGLTQQELADRVGCHKKNIENIEAGKRVLPQTLAEVAEALGVAPEEITACVTAVLELVVDRPFDSFTAGDEAHLLDTVRQRLGIAGKIKVQGKRPGSVLLTLELAAADGERLLEAVRAGSLGDLNVVTARRIEPSERVDGLAIPPPPAPGARRSLLIVDDEPFLLRLLQRQISGAAEGEFEVLTASSADEAAALFEAQPVDILLTDQRMPRRSGVELLEWVRKHHPRTVRLLMTGFTDLNDAIEGINRVHVFHFLTKPWNEAELLQVLRHAVEKWELEQSRDQLLEELQRSNRELEEANNSLRQRTQELERAAMTDPLTGLYNRRTIEHLASFEVKRRLRYPTALSIGLLDVSSPDAGPLGEDSGQVLRQLADLLTRSLREVDSIGRLEGERFLVIARETGEAGAARVAERLHARVALTPFDGNGRALSLALSIGFASAVPGVAADLETMVEVASAALESARQAACNRWEVQRVPSGQQAAG